jgi:hypothetical protein
VSEDSGRVDRSRLTFLAGAVGLALGLASRTPGAAAASALPGVTVYKSPT